MSRWKLITALLAAAPLAQAADETGKGYFMPQGGYLRADSDRAVDDDIYYGASVGKHVSKRWSVELNGNYGRYDASMGSGQLDLTGASLDALLVFNRAGAVSPFLSAGIGYIEDDLEPGRSDGDVLGQVGMGLMLDLFENSKGSFLMQLRPEVKARYDGNDSGNEGHSIDYLGGLGLMFAFGPERVSRPVAAAEPVAQPAPVVAAPPAKPVEPQPPAPPPPPPQTVVLEGVHFDFGSANLAKTSLPVLDSMAAQLQRHPRLKMEVEGHTDDRGDAAYNLRLSQHRADAVKDYLVKQGVSASQLSSTGHGEARPIADNRTADGRAMNRRVVLQAIDNPDRVKITIERE